MLTLKSQPKQKLSNVPLRNQQEICKDVRKNPSKYRSNVRFACNSIIKPVVKKKRKTVKRKMKKK